MAVEELDEHGLIKASPSVIFTYGGGTIDPLDPDPDDISIETIAHSLSLQCRFTGHTLRFYSVAEHCVHVAQIERSLEALLHDASEAYLSDLARPVKHAPGLGDVYLEAERRLEAAIATKFDLEWPWPEAVKVADERMLHREADILVPHLGELMPPMYEWVPYPWCWNPKEAEEKFLNTYYSLEGQRGSDTHE